MNELPVYTELFQPIIEIMQDSPRPLTPHEINKKLLVKLAIPRSLAELTTEKFGGPRNELVFRANWARTYMKTAQFLTQPKPRLWELTELGRCASRIDEKQQYAIVRINRKVADARRQLRKDGYLLGSRWPFTLSETGQAEIGSLEDRAIVEFYDRRYNKPTLAKQKRRRLPMKKLP